MARKVRTNAVERNKPSVPGPTGRSLNRFSGILTAKEADALERAIRSGRKRFNIEHRRRIQKLVKALEAR